MKPKKLEEPVDNYFAVVRYNSKKIKNWTLLQILIEDGLDEDMMQEQRLAAFVAEREQMSLRDTSNFAQRSLYAALKNYGFRRGREGYKHREVILDEDNDIEEWRC